APDRLLHRRRHPSHKLIALLQFPPSPHSRFSRSSLPLEEGKPEESEPCTSTDDDSSLAGQEQVVAPGLATPPNNAGEDPTILDPDSDSLFDFRIMDSYREKTTLTAEERGHSRWRLNK
ncbi:unnamed protein product, partial [Coregonus sp. 'balchen']